MAKVSFVENCRRVVTLRCPNCGQGKVFKSNPQSFSFFPEMHDNCPVCNFDFHREPGYFLGAMYASYGLAVFEGIVAFLLVYTLFPNLGTFYLALVPALVILLCSVINYKLGRVIWMYIFPRK